VNVADDDWELDYGCDEEWPKRKQDIRSVCLCVPSFSSNTGGVN